MDGIEAISAIFMITVGIFLLVALIFVFWWFSGYLCTTFQWYDLDQNAQIITCIVLLTIGGSGVIRK